METVICGHEVLRDVSSARVRSVWAGARANFPGASPAYMHDSRTCIYMRVNLHRGTVRAGTHIHGEAYPGTA